VRSKRQTNILKAESSVTSLPTVKKKLQVNNEDNEHVSRCSKTLLTGGQSVLFHNRYVVLPSSVTTSEGVSGTALQ